MLLKKFAFGGPKNVRADRFPGSLAVFRNGQSSSSRRQGYGRQAELRRLVPPKISATAAGTAKICSNFCERCLPITKSPVLQQNAPPLRGLRPQRLSFAAKRKLFLLTP